MLLVNDLADKVLDNIEMRSTMEDGVLSGPRAGLGHRSLELMRLSGEVPAALVFDLVQHIVRSQI